MKDPFHILRAHQRILYKVLSDLENANNISLMEGLEMGQYIKKVLNIFNCYEIKKLRVAEILANEGIFLLIQGDYDNISLDDFFMLPDERLTIENINCDAVRELKISILQDYIIFSAIPWNYLSKPSIKDILLAQKIDYRNRGD